MSTPKRRFPLIVSIVCLLFISSLVGCGVDETATIAQLKTLGVLVVPGTDGKVSSLNGLPTEPAKLTEAVDLMTGLHRLKSITAMDGVPLTDKHLATIGSATQLIELQINGGPVTNKGVASLTRLTKLQSLTLAGTGVTEACMPSVGKLKSLNMFNINGSNINGGYEHLQSCKNLQWILIGGVKITDEDATNISKYPSLSHVTMDGNTDISDTALKILKSVKDCNVDSTATLTSVSSVKAE